MRPERARTAEDPAPRRGFVFLQSLRLAKEEVITTADSRFKALSRRRPSLPTSLPSPLVPGKMTLARAKVMRLVGHERQRCPERAELSTTSPSFADKACERRASAQGLGGPGPETAWAVRSGAV